MDLGLKLNVSCMLVKRSANVVADCLAKEGVGRSDLFIEIASFSLSRCCLSLSFSAF